MFQPFTHPSQFYPGLIVWCDPNCREIDASTLAPSDLYDRRKARDLRPCLVVSVDYPNNSFQVSRICATTPLDTRRWVRVDTAPAITWRRASSDAWIWIGTPPTVAMVFNDAKRMHQIPPNRVNSCPVRPLAAPPAPALAGGCALPTPPKWQILAAPFWAGTHRYLMLFNINAIGLSFLLPAPAARRPPPGPRRPPPTAHRRLPAAACPLPVTPVL
ncbi:hypothetical protein B0H14DRAFT_3652148 [Mycena olivaceomarginata]|nr:hypothetical protein B0H14DRAFT_3652148 [Mycena olivaceomarginata]